MFGIVGIVIIFVMVFGGYTLAGGKMGIILKSLPFEMVMIAGAAAGTFLLSNDLAAVRHTVKDVAKVFKGPKWVPEDYRNLLCLLFELIRMSRGNPVALEEHIESPARSSIFGQYPKIQADHEVVDLICDTFRASAMNYNDPHQVEELLAHRMESTRHAALHSSHALQTVADALPALGIVAAVLGVIKTMGSIDQPPEILGKMIGGALVGTFLGVFLAYGLIGPFATRLKAVIEQDGYFLQLIQEVLVANLHSHPAHICIEVGRQTTPTTLRPTFNDIEVALKSIKQAAA